jgi:hypothetical protein
MNKSNNKRMKTLILFTPFLYTLFNKYGSIERPSKLLKYFWDYYIWKTLVYEFGGPYLLYIILVVRSAGLDINRLIVYGIWILLSLYIYEIGYILNDYFAYREPENIRNLRLSKLLPQADYINISKTVWKLLLQRFAIIFVLMLFCVMHGAILYCYAILFYISTIIPLFVLHTLITCLLIRGLVTEFALRSLRVMSTIFFYPNDISARVCLLLYSISNGVLASEGYFEAKNLTKIKLTRGIELLFKFLLMMLGIFVATENSLGYLVYMGILLLPSFIAVNLHRLKSGY